MARKQLVLAVSTVPQREQWAAEHQGTALEWHIIPVKLFPDRSTLLLVGCGTDPEDSGFFHCFYLRPSDMSFWRWSIIPGRGATAWSGNPVEGR